MRYRVSHRTTYSYDDDVSDSLGIAYLVPRELSWQHVAERALTVTPAPLDLTEDLDYYGNTATYFQVTEPHQVRDVLAVSDVEVRAPEHDDQALLAAWESARPARRSDVPDARAPTARPALRRCAAAPRPRPRSRRGCRAPGGAR